MTSAASVGSGGKAAAAAVVVCERPDGLSPPTTEFQVKLPS